jgi:hypothetical protein
VSSKNKEDDMSWRNWTRFALISCVVLAAVAVLAAPVCGEDNVVPKTGCMPVYIPPGLETGDFTTGIWVAEGPVYIGGTEYHVSVWVQDNGGGFVGKAGQTYKGTETAIYDFGNGDTFTTFVSYVALRQNDPSKWALNATERIVSGTGRFIAATGMLADTGYYGLDDPDSTTGWAYFAIHGAICNVEK